MQPQPCLRAKEPQEVQATMAAAQDEEKGPSCKNILEQVHWVPGQRKGSGTSGERTCVHLSWY